MFRWIVSPLFGRHSSMLCLVCFFNYIYLHCRVQSHWVEKKLIYWWNRIRVTVLAAVVVVVVLASSVNSEHQINQFELRLAPKSKSNSRLIDEENMYYPIGWPKIIDVVGLNDATIRQICCDRVKILFAILTDDSLAIYYTNVNTTYLLLRVQMCECECVARLQHTNRYSFAFIVVANKQRVHDICNN